MPTVAIVRGILILFYSNDHDPPHFHADGGDFTARIAISDGSVIDGIGKISPRTRKLLAAWTERHRDALMDNWRRARSYQPLQRIAE